MSSSPPDSETGRRPDPPPRSSVSPSRKPNAATGKPERPADIPPPVPAANSQGSLAAVRQPPPPPPAAATPTPVRQPVQDRGAAVASGVGSAKGVRWRGQLDRVAGEEEEEEDLVEGTLKEAPSWLISLVIHLILLLVAALIASPAGQRIGRVVLTLGPADKPSDSNEISEISMEDPMESMLESFDDQFVDEPVPVEMTDAIDALELSEVEPIESMVVPVEGGEIPIKPMVTGRSGAMKAALLAAYGGDETTVEAVELGLAWLAKQQRRDGSWSLLGPYRDGASSENKAAATAMALLAFQGDGHTHQTGKYAQQVERGMKWLIREQDREGFFAKNTRVRHAKAYAQAQATIAIGELYAMTKDSWLREPAQRAIDYAEKAQSSAGGWRYEPNNDSDLSVTGWFVMALESARSSGLEVDQQVLYRVSEYLDTVQHYDGSAYSYQRYGRPTPTMTAEGLLCRQYLGWQRNHPALVEATATMVDRHNFDMDEGNYYYWYYATQVLHHYGGQEWKLWNAKMKAQLPAAQVRRGAEIGSWAPQGSRWGSTGGRLYTTALAIYCLEVYYRHLPLYAFSDGG